jgi:hypothetical protein
MTGINALWIRDRITIELCRIIIWYGRTAGPLNPFCETQIIPAPYSYDKKKMGEKKPPAVTLGLLPE